ncbi:hypothetical protein GOC91_28415 [Sinorhizobium medicae]|uniref:hypothetical protein n=1 Tax=Sinorhizobium medicae TaxID=110321 RepID=UPI0004628C40|nr:hypothetical protein [Sinorhizobium medicae]MDX0506503.1 hypothetical protein [Sinorhizobium medicae]MDX0562011.1 hypothetical protein [Sinorhizobium medicae]MDX0574639.1 hypothetical protein [Sinorhizobium medicae]MDX0592983.1 hypothetical protein [Sinorhizobium medicae]MDX0611266.1 hypothetical protein [Sinorhizobium medicae]
MKDGGDWLRLNTLCAGGHASAARAWPLKRWALQMPIETTVGFVLFVMAFFVSAMTAKGHETSLVGIYQGSELTATADHLGQGGYELSDGTLVSFDKWYHSNWTDMRFEMLTQLSDDFGILWGASTGQRAEKVRIEPSVKLGFILQKRPTASTTLSLTVSSILGGNLTERSCTADYGAISGEQSVNCRLAASQLRPSDTLKYMINLEPSRLKIDLRFTGEF